MKHIILILSLCLISVSTYAQKQITRNSDKVERLTSPDTDRNNTPQDSTPWFKKLVYGGNFGLSYSNGWYINLSPTIGYRIVPNLIGGVGLTYVFSQYNDPYSSYRQSANIFGGNVFVRYSPLANLDVDILNNLFLHSEAEYITYKLKVQQGTQRAGLVGSAPNFFVGGGYASNFMGAGFTLSVLYNVLWTSNNPYYSSPYVIRAGFNF